MQNGLLLRQICAFPFKRKVSTPGQVLRGRYAIHSRVKPVEAEELSKGNGKAEENQRSRTLYLDKQAFNEIQAKGELMLYLKNQQQLLNLKQNDVVKPPEPGQPVAVEIQYTIPAEDGGLPDTSVLHQWRIEGSSANSQNILQAYMKLSKFRLTALVVTTALGGYLLAPGAFSIVPCLSVIAGTGLLSGAANALNQYLEVPFDSQMNRTQSRVLVLRELSPLHAVGFAGGCSAIGLGLLLAGTNPTTAMLGLLNLTLYVGVYTPMKRTHVANTWVGSLVGAIPPAMGWVASTGSLDLGALWIGAILFSWQFPHFNALSWNLRGEYARAGYCMMSASHPDMCRRVALRHGMILAALCLAAPALDVTMWTFARDSLPLNAILVYLCWRFYYHGDSASSRKLFRYTLIHLPLLIMIMLLSKPVISNADSSEKEAVSTAAAVDEV